MVLADRLPDDYGDRSPPRATTSTCPRPSTSCRKTFNRSGAERLPTIRASALEQRMDELRDHFGLTPQDLNIDLGPLGTLAPARPTSRLIGSLSPGAVGPIGSR
ncbi:gas vesicle protein GvpK [Nocardia fluminea]|uniref:gas vesicle protein GvpK n=1 Tax=Nocardia fluminea TaxID=134984 RepID=UPI0033CE3A25